jgi:predicted nuclease of predicted toxin-antitoxin system
VRWLADENVERDTIETLRAAGYEVRAIQETNPGILDPEVMRIAQSENCVIITEDLGFGELAFKSRSATHGVVLIRLTSGPATWRAKRLLEAMAAIEARMPGWFVVVQDATLRWRKL